MVAAIPTVVPQVPVIVQRAKFLWACSSCEGDWCKIGGPTHLILGEGWEQIAHNRALLIFFKSRQNQEQLRRKAVDSGRQAKQTQASKKCFDCHWWKKGMPEH